MTSRPDPSANTATDPSAGTGAPRASTGTHIVYVHGLWLNSSESLVLRRRVAHELGATVHPFRYSSVTSTMADVTARLHQFVRQIAPATLHLIGHSLGGLVIYRFLEAYPDTPPGRVVFLGTPAVASRAAVVVAQMKWAARLVGRCVAEELLVERSRRWSAAGRDLGIIAGTRNVGLGQLFARFDEDCDGTVGVSETRLDGAAGHLCLPVSHMGMLLSARVARETAGFLRTGAFTRG